ncbi:MAG TPA: ABC transporter permease [Longimicrobium sp.]|nr:ABC transporter permease [Longimicrobium sp.]
MSEWMIVLKREFRERVYSKGFLISTLLFPLFMAAVMILPAVLGAGAGGQRTLVVVDEAPAGVGDYVVSALGRPPKADDEGAYTYKVERVPGPFAAARARLNERVLSEEIDGYVHLPPDLLQASAVDYRARNLSSFRVERDIGRAVSQATQAARLRQEGLDLTEVSTLLRPVEVNGAKITERGEEAGSAQASFFLGYILGFLIYLLVFFYGVNVMRSVLEEKTNRIAEVIVSSMKASHLMFGKILGVGAVALLQVGIWTLLGVITRTQSGGIAGMMGLPPDALSSFSVSPWLVAAAIAFFLLGFFLYAALFAAMGAAVNSEQEAQQWQTLVFIPLIVPMLFLGPITNEPLGTTAMVLGLVPFSAPVTMPMRMAAATVPTWQILVSLAGIAVTVLVTAWLAGKIYRVGILSTGTKPSLRELGRWLRAA